MELFEKYNEQYSKYIENYKKDIVECEQAIAEYGNMKELQNMVETLRRSVVLMREKLADYETTHSQICQNPNGNKHLIERALTNFVKPSN